MTLCLKKPLPPLFVCLESNEIEACVCNTIRSFFFGNPFFFGRFPFDK